MAQTSSQTAEPGSPNATSGGHIAGRISIRKRRFIKYGRRIARLRIGRTREIFAIHEELLCAHSPYFRAKLQMNRKPIEGECSICHEEMIPAKKEITFCRSGCGANIHHDCMEKWIDQKSAASEAITCPLCRRSWPNASSSQTLLYQDLNAQAFEVYQEWIYQQHIALEEVEAPLDHRLSWNEHKRLFRAYILGVRIKDKLFCNAVLRALTEVFQDTDIYPCGEIISWVYSNTTKSSRVRKLLAVIYAVRAEDDWFDEDDDNHYPMEFMRDLTTSLLSTRSVQKDGDEDMRDIRAKYCTTNAHEEEVLRSEVSSSDEDTDSDADSASNGVSDLN